MDWSLRHFQLCPGFSAMSQCRHTHLPWKEHGMSCSVFHWKFQLKYSALNYCFLSNFSLHFFEIDASTKLDFFNAKYLTFLGGRGNKVKFQFAFPSSEFFLALNFPCDILYVCYKLQTLQVHRYVLSPFMSHSTFVITQTEQHDLQLFKAACAFCKKRKNEKEKKQKVI